MRFHCVAQAALEILSSSSLPLKMLGLQACATAPRPIFFLIALNITWDYYLFCLYVYYLLPLLFNKKFKKLHEVVDLSTLGVQ